jgi:hypothetical protein
VEKQESIPLRQALARLASERGDEEAWSVIYLKLWPFDSIL